MKSIDGLHLSWDSFKFQLGQYHPVVQTQPSVVSDLLSRNCVPTWYMLKKDNLQVAYYSLLTKRCLLKLLSIHLNASLTTFFNISNLQLVVCPLISRKYLLTNYPSSLYFRKKTTSILIEEEILDWIASFSILSSHCMRLIARKASHNYKKSLEIQWEWVVTSSD